MYTYNEWIDCILRKKKRNAEKEKEKGNKKEKPRSEINEVVSPR